jgi:site-specific recombinase
MTDPRPAELSATVETRLDGHGGILALTTELGRRLDRLGPSANHPDRVDALIDLLHWVFDGPDNDVKLMGPQATGAWQMDSSAVDRVHLLVTTLHNDVTRRTRLRETLLATLSHCEARGLFGDFGMPSERGFLAEGSERLLGHLLPRPRDDQDMADLLRRWLDKPRVAAHVQRVTPEAFAGLMEELCPSASIADWKFLAQDFADGMRLLALRITAQGLTRKLRQRQPPEPLTSSPFHKLQLTVDRVVTTWLAGDPLDHALESWKTSAAECRTRIGHIRSLIETQGVSVDIVYGLEVMERGLRQLDSMIEWISLKRGTMRWALLRRMLVRSAGLIHQGRSVIDLARANLNMLHCKIVERAGGTGEHYIATTRSDYGHIWLASLGGGLLTVLTVAGKCALATLHATGLVVGIGYGLNYAASFVAMQHLGLMLATKQPAMTAATLAVSLRDCDDQKSVDYLTRTALSIVTSQVASAAANVLAVALGCVVFNQAWQAMTGHSFLTTEKATNLLTDLSPVDSLTIFYAAFTGVILWSSSLIGGWVDNWSAYHRVPQGISDHPLGQRFGRERMVALGRFVRRHIAGWGTNISLGMMLGLAPEIGHFLGIPLDVRHVTLNSGMLALACTTEGVDWWSRQALSYALAGIACMFVLNLGVSFTLSLWTALRAQGLSGRLIVTLYGRVFLHLLRRPWRVVVPEFTTTNPPHSSSVS